MTIPSLSRSALTCCVAIAMLAGCGGSHSPLSAPGVLPQGAITELRHRMRPLEGTSFTLLYVFKGGNDGANPMTGLASENGEFYGTTHAGGIGLGTVFRFAQHTETILHTFKGGTDGSEPLASLLAINGALYGTTVSGGSSSSGTVFKLEPEKNGYQEKILHAFKNGSDGAEPNGTLVAVNGKLYGTTVGGGNFGLGIIFELMPSGSGYKETILHTFKGGSDGSDPTSLVAANGALYGIAGTTVFKRGLTDADYSVLYRFKPGVSYPTSLFAGDGRLIGTAYGGEAHGFVFQLGFSGSDYRVLYSFQGGSYGANPTSVISHNGTLYGTTYYGKNCEGYGPYGCGTVFALTPAGSGYTERILHNFGGSGVGLVPTGLVFAYGALFGTTSEGGNQNRECSRGCGTIFKVAP
jgi:uncharacterized repeat protein (TIGR03803 family)